MIVYCSTGDTSLRDFYIMTLSTGTPISLFHCNGKEKSNTETKICKGGICVNCNCITVKYQYPVGPYHVQTTPVGSKWMVGDCNRRRFAICESPSST